MPNTPNPRFGAILTLSSVGNSPKAIGHKSTVFVKIPNRMDIKKPTN